MLLTSSEFEKICKSSTVYLDTNIFVYAFEDNELLDLIAHLTVNAGVAFVTLSSVEHEFTRGSQSLQEIRDRKEFVRGLVRKVQPVGPLLESDRHEAFSVAMSLTIGKKDSQYTDYLIAVAAHKYASDTERQYILSADVPAFPSDIFTIRGVISLEVSKNKIVHINLIELDQTKYEGIIKNIANK